ncbi:MAG TPA: single-stranded-DNA-specific exonuclease RecJ, partial [Candidatus Angelobacter sp.]|nr:single-stranded-DNA-specific exonuclease RecJ [Candidatus Angelobacter sp.]
PHARASFSYEAVGWRMAARLNGEPYQLGDRLDLAFTVIMNEHPEFGGLELKLEDFRRPVVAATMAVT